MVDLMSIKFTSVTDNIAEHIDRLAGLIEQRQGMGSKLDETLSIGILVASKKVACSRHGSDQDPRQIGSQMGSC